MKRNKPLSDQGARRFVKLKREAAASTGLALDSPRINYLATLALQAERLQCRIIAGDDSVTTAELLALRTAIEQLSPLPPQTVTVEYVDSLPKDPAPSVSETSPPGAGLPRPPPSEPPPPTTSAPPPAAQTNVVPLRSVHDHPFAPLARHDDEPWRDQNHVPGWRRFDFNDR
jgi:hypothetical protein